MNPPFRASLNLNAAAADPVEKQLMEIVINVSSKLVRTETLEGKKYSVVPMVMLTVGVHNGSAGNVYYSDEELAKTPEVWNHKPIIVYHRRTKNGKGVGACHPDVLNQHKIGMVMNAQYVEGKGLVADAYIDLARAKEVDIRVWNAIKNETMMELSTGLFADNQMTEGVWNGESYTAIACNLRPDHLAVLPDEVGACSTKDGAGFIRNQIQASFQTLSIEEVNRVWERVMTVLKEDKEEGALKKFLENELSYEQIRELLHAALRKKYPEEKGYAHPWVEAVYDDEVVYSLNSKLFKLGYSATDTGVNLAGEPSAVVRITEYRPVVVANTDPSKSNKKDETMKKEQLVADLIANCGYKEEHREWLMGMDDKQLNGIRDAAKIVENKAKEAAKTATPPPADPTKVENEGKGKEKVKLEDVLNADQQAALSYGQRKLTEDRAKLVSEIIANKQNKFTAEQLNSMSIELLENVAAVARVPADQSAPAPQANYGGMAPVVPIDNARLKAEDCLPLPKLAFGD